MNNTIDIQHSTNKLYLEFILLTFPCRHKRLGTTAVSFEIRNCLVLDFMKRLFN